jgi:transposase-like protein
MSATTRWARSCRVRLVISDAHEGLKKAIRRCFAGASWQRCRVHYARNLLANVPKNQVEFVAAAFRSIFALGTVEEIVQRWDEVAATLDERFPKAAASMRGAKTDVLAFGAFPKSHWRKIWSNNPLERLNKEVKRRSTLSGSSPTTAPSSASSARYSPINTTNGPSLAATCPTPQWPNSPKRAPLTTSPKSRAEHTEHHTRNPTTPRHSARRGSFSDQAQVDRLAEFADHSAFGATSLRRSGFCWP